MKSPETKKSRSGSRKPKEVQIVAQVAPVKETEQTTAVIGEVAPEAKKPALNARIAEFITSILGKTRLERPETVIMFGLYNEYYKANERDYTCDLCAVRIYTRLRKIKEAYDKERSR